MKFFTVTATCKVADGRDNFMITGVKRLPDTITPELNMLLRVRFEQALEDIWNNAAKVQEIRALQVAIEESQLDVDDMYNTGKESVNQNTWKEHKAVLWPTCYPA